MTMIFKRDEKGLLHQLDITLDDLPEGTGTNLLVAQHMYIVFTDKEQAAFDQQKKEAQERLLAEKRAADEAKVARAANQELEIAKANALQKAREEAEAAKDSALALALEQLAELKQKVSKMESAKAAS